MFVSSPQLSDIYRFRSVTDNLGTAGQPTAEQFEAVKAAGYEVVINLAMGNTPRDLPNEAQLLAEHGIDYIHIPVVFERPTEADLNRFFDAMADNQDKKCFVHCIANARVSAFVLLYRVLRQGVPVEEARASMRQIWEPNATWQTFINDALAQGRSSSR
jgi:protein tyrosine phosphatase (PTP) superfamily phosphohydrolase (DUF442 family)